MELSLVPSLLPLLQCSSLCAAPCPQLPDLGSGRLVVGQQGHRQCWREVGDGEQTFITSQEMPLSMDLLNALFFMVSNL